MIEWVFLFSVMSGAFTPGPLDDPKTGWAHVERGRVASASLGECEAKAHAMAMHYKLHPVIGGAVVVTGCEPRRVG